MSQNAVLDKILLGVSWYPEMWPEDEWARDLDKMHELGYRAVRMFEFAWHRCEPDEGAYDLAWAVKVMDLCAQRDIRVIVGTPSAAPPAWLTSQYPEVLMTAANGKRMRHGQRRHVNPHSRKYRELCAGIVAIMVKAFAGHPALMAWHIDNEMNGFDYGQETRELFHKWLEEHYGTVEALNRAWGLEFWSQAYSAFEQVPLCAAPVGGAEVPNRDHPSLLMAIARFQNEGWSAFIRQQCEIIRAASSLPITTNMTPTFQMDWFKHNRELDVAGHSLYRDIDHYGWNVALYDRMRPEKQRPYWLLETAPNWSAGGRIWNIHRHAAGIRLTTWLSVILGGEMVLYWQWRQHWAGQEMLHGTLLTATGKWRPAAAAHRSLCGELDSHSVWLQAHPPAPAKVALLAASESAWVMSIDPTDENMNYSSLLRDVFHRTLLRNHIWRDVVAWDADWEHYQVILAPCLPIMPGELRHRLADWVRGGGRLMLGPFSGTHTHDMTVWRDQEFGGLEELMGAASAMRFTAQALEHEIKVVFDGDTFSRTRAWCEAFECDGAGMLARYDGGYGDGLAAVIEHAYGKGSVITCGCLLEEQALLRVIKRLTAEAGVEPVAAGAPDVVVVPRCVPGGRTAGYALANLSAHPQRIRLPSRGKDRLTAKEAAPYFNLPPYDVALIEV